MSARSSSARQLSLSGLVDSCGADHPFPSTRYQGSKKKIVDWIWDCLAGDTFETVLDAFGGTGCVAHMFKRHGKAVTYNDQLTFNYIIGRALIENGDTLLSASDVEFILSHGEAKPAPCFIQKTFAGIYYTAEENRWLDRTIQNIRVLPNERKQALALFALFQACIAKRPYNLFHRANLYLRTNDGIERSFGNKTTWDRPFEDHFRTFVREANAAVFDNGHPCVALNRDACALGTEDDLVYIDPPYISQGGVSTDYLNFYHFLEGICRYDRWGECIDRKYKHLPLKKTAPNPWMDPKAIHAEFAKLFERFQASILAVSYRKDGIPSIEQLLALMKKYKARVEVYESSPYQYVLSKKATREVLLVGR